MNRDSFIKVESKIYQAVKRQKKNIIIYDHLSANNIYLIMNSLINDYPDLFYISNWEYKITEYYVVLKPIYTLSHKEILDIDKECKIQKKFILSRVEGLSQLEIVKRIHDILIRNIKYSYDDNDFVHTIVGGLVFRKAVCDGYSKLFKLLLDDLNINCIIVNGKGFNKTLVDSENHAWNMICLDGNWYHVDVTYDNSLSVPDFIRYDYFLVNDNMIRNDHYYDVDKYPKAIDDSLYQYVNK